ncbi:MAG: SO_0444 family Cu/Zn efflux transporter [Desulfobacterales bacterium]
MLPAAVSLRKQGASNGATTAFLISTPESGVDSISITYALLDPIMTVARPVVAFVTAAVAGITENFFGASNATRKIVPDLSCPVDGCCDGQNCSPEEHRHHHTFWEKFSAGMRFAIGDLWEDLALWFLIGLVLAGLITVLIPPDIFGKYLGAGLPAMLIMLAVGIPLYICATASTPIAAALILKGVSPGAALVFLLAGPATNMASLTVLTSTLGKRATAIYLASIAVCAVVFGLIVDQVYASLGISAQAAVGQASEIVPEWAGLIGAIAILGMSIKPVWNAIRARFKPAGPQAEMEPEHLKAHAERLPVISDCGPDCDCSSGSNRS